MNEGRFLTLPGLNLGGEATRTSSGSRTTSGTDWTAGRGLNLLGLAGLAGAGFGGGNSKSKLSPVLPENLKVTYTYWLSSSLDKTFTQRRPTLM